MYDTCTNRIYLTYTLVHMLYLLTQTTQVQQPPPSSLPRHLFGIGWILYSSAKSEFKVRQRVTCRVVLCVVFVHNKVLFAYLIAPVVTNSITFLFRTYGIVFSQGQSGLKSVKIQVKLTNNLASITSCYWSLSQSDSHIFSIIHVMYTVCHIYVSSCMYVCVVHIHVLYRVYQTTRRLTYRIHYIEIWTFL